MVTRTERCDNVVGAIAPGAVADDDVVAGLGKSTRDRRTDATARPRDDGEGSHQRTAAP
jgi:sugar (pentulose or hexulose) kinase